MVALRFIFSSSFLLLHLHLLIPQAQPHSLTKPTSTFSIQEATVDDIRVAFKEKRLTSKQLVEFYLKVISKLNPTLHAVIETNPDALIDAEKADKERQLKGVTKLPMLHGIPVLLKDNISTKDKLNTTAGSFALLGSVVPRDAGVVKRLRRSGAVILGKASLSEWANFRSSIPNGWSARGLQGKNPYVLSADPLGSSSGSAISVVGIKPSVGLTSRAGVVPISLRQDSVGPICRRVSDSVHVLDAIVGYDPLDEATKTASKYIPKGGYKQYLRANGLKGKRLGIVFGSLLDHDIKTLRQEGAIVIENLTLPYSDSGESIALLAEFKISLNAYLRALVKSPVRSLADVIAFNKKNAKKEKLKEWGQEVFLEAEATNGMSDKEKAALRTMEEFSRNGIEKLMKEKKLDAIVTYGYMLCSVLAIGGYPGITVPAGYDSEGVPFGISFGGLRFSEPKLIEIAYGFEQATLIRKPPKFKA
ncbi:Amidase signature domain-containing protein [Hirschfeldia incana]|nr:Amidase signature domain-containing protein [Hirschfeldia incana]